MAKLLLFDCGYGTFRLTLSLKIKPRLLESSLQIGG
jgi:ribonuclease BN (tRNA processing enzyme)